MGICSPNVFKWLTEMKCQYCKNNCVKNGRRNTGVQRYYCKSCKKSQQSNYEYKSCLRENVGLFLSCLKNGCSLNATFRITGVSVSTQLRRIKKLGKSIVPFPEYKQGDVYELDEMKTYVGRKKRPVWVMLAKSSVTGRIVDMQIGSRTKRSLKRVTDKLLLLYPKAIFTDGLKEYRYLIPESIHKVKRYGTNHIERFNLTLRTHISRLNCRTICYSKSKLMLEYTIKIYLWG